MRAEVDAEFEKLLDPIAGSPATGKSVVGIINLFADDRFGTGGIEMEQRFSARLQKDFHDVSEDWNDVTLTGQNSLDEGSSIRIVHIEVSQEKAMEELEEIPVDGMKHERRPPLYPCNAYKIQKPSWTDKLVAE